MQFTKLGRTGLNVSRLCLGTMNFGPQTSEADSHAMMDRALELGINFFDTADVYGWVNGEGITEKILGTWFAKGGWRRDHVVLATKVYNHMNIEGRDDPNRRVGLNARKIISHCDDSLRRLQTDRIDLYQMHHIDRSCPLDEIWEAMDILKRQGKIVYVGSSNFAGWDIATACQEAQKLPTVGLVSEQSIYNLDNRMVELEVIPACRHYGLGLIPWSPLGGGYLGGVLAKMESGRRASEGMRKRVEEHRDQVEAWEKLCADLGEKPADVALAWLLSNPVVTAPIIGPRTMEQLEGSLRALEIELATDTLEKLDQIFPGPGGEAPKAYAW